MNRFLPGLRPGLAYGVLAFVAGAVLGPLRELVLAPWIGSVPAALIEAAVMAVVLWKAAGIAARALPDGPAAAPRAAMAVVGVVVALAGEILLGLAFEVSGLAAQRPTQGGAEELIGLLLLGWLAAAPFRVRRPGG